MSDYEIFEAGDVPLQCGITLRGARLAYKTHGALNAARDNAVVFPTRYGGTHVDNEAFIGEGMALDPARYFIVVPNLLNNGLSSSPSNTPPPFDRARFPLVTVCDNVRLQYRLLTEVLGVERIALATGWSMGAQQAFHYGALYPEQVARIAPFCGAARTTPHTFVFIEGVAAPIMADAAWKEGWYRRPPERGLRACARTWAGWALSQAFYRKEMYRRMDAGFASLEDFLTGYWEAAFLHRDANDMLALMRTWQRCDISDNELHGGDFERALGAIRARAVVMPGSSDLYFPPEDSAYEVEHMPNAELRVIPSDWGHYAGSGRDAADRAFIDAALKELLATPAER